jgi:type IV pilus assembly protein PilB
MPLTTIDAPSVTYAARSQPGRLLGDVIVELGFCDRHSIEEAVAEARDSGRPMGQLLIEHHKLRPHQLGIAIAERFGLQYVDLHGADPDPTAMALVPEKALRRLDAVPIGFRDDGSLLVAMVDPRNLLAMDDLSMLTARTIVPVIVTREDLDSLIRRVGHHGRQLESQADVEADEEAARQATIEQTDDDGPTVKLVRSIISEAVEGHASDIHFDPDSGGLLIRYRVDGMMRDVTRVGSRQSARVISRIKILSDLDISERRKPQDGRLSLTIDERRVDVRVTIVPLVAGEAAVLRILDNGGEPLTLAQLGMSDADRARVETALKRSHGAILSTGPTGSGKTTTLYAAVGVVSTPEKNLMTIEDPVEYRLERVKQMQVFPAGGVTFATGLRSIVRADPDVIMVGEIRDQDSAKIAIEAALTGHLLLSSLHTNSAPATLARLVDMGIEPYLVASALECVIGQRLVRLLCPDCKRPVIVPGADVGLAVAEASVYEAAGCARCGDSGYRGRLGIYEVMTVTDAIRTLIVRNASTFEISAVAIEEGMRTLRDDGLAKVIAGRTSLAEIARVAS